MDLLQTLNNYQEMCDICPMNDSFNYCELCTIKTNINILNNINMRDIIDEIAELRRSITSILNTIDRQKEILLESLKEKKNIEEESYGIPTEEDPIPVKCISEEYMNKLTGALLYYSNNILKINEVNVITKRAITKRLKYSRIETINSYNDFSFSNKFINMQSIDYLNNLVEDIINITNYILDKKSKVRPRKSNIMDKSTEIFKASIDDECDIKIKINNSINEEEYNTWLKQFNPNIINNEDKISYIFRQMNLVYGYASTIENKLLDVYSNNIFRPVFEYYVTK